MKGCKCRCGLATVGERLRCPRCGKPMRPAEWPDHGKVLSFAMLQVVPEGLDERYNLALVGVPRGPKVVCWTRIVLREDELVRISDRDGMFFCER